MTIEQRRSLPSDTQIIATHHRKRDRISICPDRRRSHCKRQVSAGDGAGRAMPRHDHQCRRHAGVSRAARAHGATLDRGRTPRPSRALRHPACRRTGQRRVVAWSGAGGDGSGAGAGRLPILTGGTGLYLAALTQGLAAIPDPGPAARDEARRLLKDIGPAALAYPPRGGGPRGRCPPASHRQPAYRPRLGDLAGYRAKPHLMAGACRSAGALALRRHSDRPAARPNCVRRSPLGSRECWPKAPWKRCGHCWRSGLDPALPAMRAHGVPELADYLRGDFTLAEADAADRTGDRPIHQAAGDMVPPPSTCRAATRAYDPCAICDW